MKKSLFITQGAIIAALYVALTFLANSMGLANHAIQVRFSEALTILPFFTPAAVPGLFVGCLISNLLTDGVLANIIFGSLATLLAAVLTRLMRKNMYLAPIPPIVVNAIVVPLILMYAYQIPGSFWYFAFTVFVGQFISAGILGMLLLFAIKKRSNIFK